MCTTLLSELSAPFKYGSEPCLVAVIDYVQNKVIGIDLSTGFAPKEAICETDIYLAWLNKKGGIDRFAFRGMHEYGGEVQDTTTFVDTNGFELVGSRGLIRRKVTAYAGRITKFESFYLRSLRESPLAWTIPLGALLSPDEWLPCYVAPNTYTDYKRGEAILNASVELIISERINVQAQ